MLTIGGHRTTKTVSSDNSNINGHNYNNNLGTILSSPLTQMFGNGANNNVTNLSTSNSTTNSSTTSPTSFSNINNNATISRNGKTSMPTQQQQPTAKAI